MSTTEIDVRQIPPMHRHPTIFDQLDQADAGDVVRLVNDHNPKPLHYQLDAERPGQFDWTVVEDGPERWVVDIVSRVHRIDARPVIAAGREPFDDIMTTAAKVAPGEVLVVLAPFEPVPLEGVLAEQGFQYVADQINQTDWRVTFLRS